MHALCDKFTNIQIVKIDVRHDKNRDGEDILRIVIVFDGTIKKADAKQVAGAARYIKPGLTKIDADLFPLLSFVSKLDYEESGRGEVR